LLLSVKCNNDYSVQNDEGTREKSQKAEEM